MKIIPTITLNVSKKIDIYIESGILASLTSIIDKYSKTNRVVLITDDNVKKLYTDKLAQDMVASGYDTHILSIGEGEKSKNLDNVSSIYYELNKLSFNRYDMIIAVGGGVVGDIAGFVAATYMRGIAYIQVPTTLLAQIDSSIGGKTGVNLSSGKNLIGSIYQPKAIIIDPEVLSSLSINNMNDGLGEAIKYGMIADKTILELLKSGLNDNKLIDIISKCVKIKVDVVRADEFEGGLRMILNFGHTFGHAIEKCMNYIGITHGQAVCIGMVYATKIGEKMGITVQGTAKELVNLLEQYNLPIENGIGKDIILNAIKSDKKMKNNSVNFVFITDVEKPIIKAICIEELEAYYE